MRTVARVGLVVGVLFGVIRSAPVTAQAPATAGAAQPRAAPPPPSVAMPINPALPPATMLEGFRQPIGSTLTIGYDELGEVDGVFVDVRELRDTMGGRARGLVVEIAGGEALREQSYVDADEIPALLKAVDDLVAIPANPTQFRSFEVRYMTRGELGLTASSSRNRGIVFGVEVGRVVKARRALNTGEMRELRTLFEAASEKLRTLVPEK